MGSIRRLAKVGVVRPRNAEDDDHLAGAVSVLARIPMGSTAITLLRGGSTQNWRALRVSGDEVFKRMVWLEASVRDVKIPQLLAEPGRPRGAEERTGNLFRASAV